MGKHAYCIIAHNDRYCLEKLISMLDNERHDIFILPDKKTSPDFESGIETKKSYLEILPKDKRVDVRWGHISLVEAEITAIEAALKKDRYNYIHLISGVDLPIKSIDHIQNFFDSQLPDTLFVAVNENPDAVEEVFERVKYYNILTKYQKSSNRILKIASALINKTGLILQKSLGIKRDWKNYVVRKGSNWVTLSDEFARFLADRKKLILKKYRGIKCADEIFIQTEIMSSHFKEKLYRDSEGHTDHMRLIEFEGDSPRVFSISDYEELIQSPDLFARKFSSQTDKSVIDRIFENSLTG